MRAEGSASGTALKRDSGAAVCAACLAQLAVRDGDGAAMWTCAACRSVSCWPRPSAGELDVYYNGEYTVADTGLTLRRRANWQGLIEAAASRVGRGRGIEIGSSTGAFLRLAASNGWEMCGVELDARARDASAREAPGVPVWASLAEARARAASRWDAAWLLHTVEHFLAPDAVLRDIRAALQPEGILVVTTPNGDSAECRLLGALWEWWTPPAHLSLFSPLGARVLLERAGFEVVSLETRRGDSLGAAANLLLAPARWLKRRGGGSWRQRSSARAASQRVAALVNALYDPLSWPLRRRLYRDLQGPELVIVARPSPGRREARGG